MKHNTLILFIFLFTSVSVSFAQTDNEQEIRELEKQWLIESYKTGDMSNFDKIVAEGFRITHSNGQVLTKTEKRADIVKNQIKNPLPEDVFAIDESSVKVTFHGTDTAVSKGFIIENYFWQSKRYLDNVHFTNTYQKQNGDWKVISTQLTRLNQTQSEGEMGYIPVEGDERIFYQKIGSGEQVVIVPLHLFRFESFKHLANNRTMIFYDPRNRGRSDRFEKTENITVQQDVEDLEKLHKHFGLEKVTLVGQSYLGTMVVMYALKYPNYVEKIIQIGPPPLKIDKQFPKELTAQDATPVPDPAEAAKIAELRKQNYHLTNPKDFCEKDWAVTRTILVGNPKNAERLEGPCLFPNEWAENLGRHWGNLYPSLQKLDIPTSEIAKVKVPVLTIHGTQDRQAAYGAGKEWVEMLPNSRLLTVKGAAHVPQADEPFYVFSAIENFLSGKPIIEVIPQEVTFKSTEDVNLFADVYESPKGKTAPLIMLFHQGGGDARGEYQPLIPKLLEQNYNVIAVDLRTGGNRFGSENRTVAALNGKEFSYCDAYADLEATLDYAKSRGFTGKKIAWGSSFSAALVFQLATKREKDLAGILSFSPASGGPMVACKPDLFVADLKIPTLALRPKSEMQRESSQTQFAMFMENNIQTYVSENGVHGSSMLVDSQIEGSAEEHWKIVLEFIEKTLKN